LKRLKDGMDTTLALFTFLGFLGGLTHALILSRSWKEFKEFRRFKLLIIGAIVGFIYFFLHSEWTFPNMVMSFVSGYAGPSFIESLITRVKAPAR